MVKIIVTTSPGRKLNCKVQYEKNSKVKRITIRKQFFSSLKLTKKYLAPPFLSTPSIFILILYQ